MGNIVKSKESAQDRLFRAHPISKEQLYVKAVCESTGAEVIGVPDFGYGIFSVRDCETNQNRVVSEYTICRRTNIEDKNKKPVYEYDLLKCSRFGEKEKYAFIFWSDYDKKWMLKSFFTFGGASEPSKYIIESVGNILTHDEDADKIRKQDEEENSKECVIDNSYCPSMFKK